MISGGTRCYNKFFSQLFVAIATRDQSRDFLLARGEIDMGSF